MAQGSLRPIFEWRFYIVLNTIKGADNRFSYDVHFWLGQYTSQDEAGTAAYKTVELDDHLGTLPVQHRELQGYESTLFLSYFHPIRILEGGVETGFHHFTAPEYQKRLYQVVGAQNRDVRVLEVPLNISSINGGDVFVLDAGKEIFLWNGGKASAFEKTKALAFVQTLENERGTHVTIHRYEQGDSAQGTFFQALGGQANATIPNESSGANLTHVAHGESVHKNVPKRLFSLSDAGGSLKLTQIAEGAAVKHSLLKSDDAFILDAGDHIWVWIGKGASVKERRYALGYAHQYLKEHSRPFTLPLSRIGEGQESRFFEIAIGH